MGVAVRMAAMDLLARNQRARGDGAVTLTLTNARLIDPEGDRILDGGLVVEGGRIREIFTDARPGLDCGGACLAPGIIDIGVKVGEPGERHKESFRTAGAAAAAGGVTTIVTRPDTAPGHRRARAARVHPAPRDRDEPRSTSCRWRR